MVEILVEYYYEKNATKIEKQSHNLIGAETKEAK